MINRMTNEEAKAILLGLSDNPLVVSEYLLEALDVAIKALEQQPITWIMGKDNCQVAVRNMSINKMQKICAIIGNEELAESEVEK